MVETISNAPLFALEIVRASERSKTMTTEFEACVFNMVARWKTFFKNCCFNHFANENVVRDVVCHGYMMGIMERSKMLSEYRRSAIANMWETIAKPFRFVEVKEAWKLSNILRCPLIKAVRFFRLLNLYRYDLRRFGRCSGVYDDVGLDALVAKITMGYHVLEKGITMPRRHLDFGHAAVENLIELVDTFEKRFPDGDGQVDHAIGCIKEYLQIHQDAGFDRTGAYWARLQAFCAAHPHVATACQRKCSRAEFYKDLNGPFPAFAASRHTVRHYSGMVPVDVIKRAVELAMTAPSACNRQYVKVYCISDHAKRDAIYALQNGNRGFGSDADKLLAVTADLSGIRWAEERNDAYTNAGIVLMNLSYALHYGKIAHCILNWSVHPQSDRKAHAILGIPENEVIAALVACGNAPEEFLVASSPRKLIGKVFHEIV